MQHKTGWTSERERRRRSRGTWSWVSLIFRFLVSARPRLCLFLLVHSSCESSVKHRRETSSQIQTNSPMFEVSHRAEPECWSRCSTSDPIHCIWFHDRRVWGWRQKHEVYKIKSPVFHVHTSSNRNFHHHPTDQSFRRRGSPRIYNVSVKHRGPNAVKEAPEPEKWFFHCQNLIRSIW